MKTTSRQANMQSKPRPRAQTQNGRMHSPLARRKFGAHGSGRPTMRRLAKVRVSVGRAVLCAPPQRKLQINDETLLRATSFEHMGFLHHSRFVTFLGNVGCLFAATINAAPMTMRKNEKNWPRVNGPISSASGSRKFSTRIRKIA